MKYNKSLTILSALVLVLSLGSCQVEDDESINNNLEEIRENLETFQNAILSLGSHPFNDWEAYKYVLTGDENKERLLKSDSDNTLYGYSIEDDSREYFLDGTCYSNYKNTIYEVKTIDTSFSSYLGEDDWFVLGDDQAIDNILNIEAKDITSLTISGDRYTLIYDREEDFGEKFGKYSYTNTYSFTITDGELVSVSSVIRETHLGGTLDTSEYTKTNSEYIKRVEPNDISYVDLVEVGYDYIFWETEQERDIRLATSLLEAVNKISSLSSKFGAVHVEEYDGASSENVTIYLTNDDNGNPYGFRQIYSDVDHSNTTYYYYDGARYDVKTDSDGNEDRIVQNSDFGTFSSLIDGSYSDAINNVPSINDIVDDFALNITSSGYELVVSISTGFDGKTDANVTYETTTDFDLVGISYYEDEDHYYRIEKVTSSDISKQMSTFSKFFWDVEAQNPAEMLEKIYYNCNYSLILKYDAWTTDMTMTYAEYQEDYANGQAKINEMYNSLEITTSYVLDFHYTEEALCYDEYILNEEDDYEYVFGTIVLNTDSGCTQYMTYDNEEWEVGGSYSFSWQDSTYTLVDAYSYNVGNYFSYYGYGTYNGEYCDAYRLTSSSAKNNYFLCLGNYHLWSSASTTSLYYTHYLTYFFPQSEAMIANFYNEGWSYSGSLTVETEMTYVDYEINAYVYDVGNTDINDSLAKIQY